MQLNLILRYCFLVLAVGISKVSAAPRGSLLTSQQSALNLGSPNCPAPFKRCLVQSRLVESELIPQGEGYVCVNVEEYVHSCGGCTGGDSPDGIDCESLPGVVLGTATCSAGQCQISKCQPGYSIGLNGDRCVEDDQRRSALRKQRQEERT